MSEDAAAPTPRFRVVRMDDHGNRFEVGRTATRAEAEALAAEYTAKLHHQVYWVEELGSSAALP